MKICLVSLNALPALSAQHQYQNIGGAEVHSAQLAVSLTKLGHEVNMVVGDFDQPDGTVYFGVRTLKTFKRTAGLPLVRYVHPRWTSIWSAISRADAEVYYYTCAGMILGMLAIYCRINKRRLVFRAASDSDCDPHSVLTKYWRDRWLYGFGLKRTDTVLVQSATQQSAMQSNYGVASTIVPGLVERPLDRSGVAAKDIDVLWVANMRQLKRPDRLLELARILPQYKFHIVGGAIPGEEKFYDSVEANARKVSNVTFHGRVPYFEIGQLFDRAHLLTNTSEIEGFPNTFLQAWVRGIPVVTMFDPDGVVSKEALGSAHATVADMASGLESLLNSKEMYAQARARILAFMDLRFNQEKALGPYLDALTGTTLTTGAHEK